MWRSSPSNVEPSPLDLPLDVPPPTEIRLNPGEPTLVRHRNLRHGARAADGHDRGRPRQLHAALAFNLYESSAYIVERTPWVPAADFNQRMGLDGVTLEGSYGSIYFSNNMDWQDGWVEGALEVSQWNAFMERRAAYPVLEWCRGPLRYRARMTQAVLMPRALRAGSARVRGPAALGGAPSRAVIVVIAGHGRKSHTQLAGACRRDGSRGEIGTTQSEHSGACSTRLASAKPDQSKDSAVRQAANNRKLAKILVEGNQDASFDAGLL